MCNQYKCKHHKPVGLYLLGFLALMELMTVGYLYSQPIQHILSPLANAQGYRELIPDASASGSMVVVEAGKVTTPPEILSQQPEIEKYIKTIFGKDSKVAIAVSHHECSPQNPKYPKCQLHTSHENSIGLFQINIQSETTKVHWSRIPGNTLEEKKEWLENPYNNTLLAYWIFQTSGWNPWSAYTSGRYLASM